MAHLYANQKVIHSISFHALVKPSDIYSIFIAFLSLHYFFFHDTRRENRTIKQLYDVLLVRCSFFVSALDTKTKTHKKIRTKVAKVQRQW